METQDQSFGKFSREVVGALKAKHQRIILVSNPDSGHEALCRAVDESVWNDFQSAAADPSLRTLAEKRMVLSVLLAQDPEFASVDEMLFEQPGLVDTFAEQLLKFAGLGQRVESKVLGAGHVGAVGKFSEATVQEAKGGHSKILWLRFPETGHEVLCKPVREPEYLRHESWRTDANTRAQAPAKLLKLVTLKPDPAFPGVDDMLREYPGLGDSFASALVKQAGFTRKGEKKVL